MTESDYIVSGFAFGTLADADIAREEEKKIKYLEGSLNLDDPEGVLAIYQKMLENRIFVTPVGLAFLQRIRAYLMKTHIEDDRISDIPLYTAYASRITAAPKKSAVRVEPKKGPDIRGKLRISILLNIGLLLLVVVMFVIALKADTPNILNYKHTLENQYASWEQELKERESAVREKERELSIEREE